MSYCGMWQLTKEDGCIKHNHQISKVLRPSRQISIFHPGMFIAFSHASTGNCSAQCKRLLLTALYQSLPQDTQPTILTWSLPIYMSKSSHWSSVGQFRIKKDSRHSDQGITLLLLKTVGTPTKGSLIYNELQHGKSPKVQREQWPTYI